MGVVVDVVEQQLSPAIEGIRTHHLSVEGAAFINKLGGAGADRVD